MLLLGLDGLGTKKRNMQAVKDLHWSSVLIVSKDSSIVPWSAAFIPLSDFGFPNRNADSVTETTDEDGRGRTVTLTFGSDTMSIWMPLREQLAEIPIAVPQASF